ncbi:ankyrin repeat domain-containing protein [Dyella sp. ASV21]|uniref:ankyrin repeat domain-containing protein n=1 Tax=Dyella sp. ASV21 TaxID=2795114 RepID=UPI0018EE0357|nr:ankyrin repeat domain-containing protein [Dyella sp. ASV21]
MEQKRTIEEILQSTSDVIYPAELGARRVTLDSCDCDGDTPLHVMVWRDDVDGVRALIEAGAPVNAVGDMGATPLYVAVLKDLPRIAEALRQAGADPDIRSEFGDTPRERAMAAGGELAILLR